MNYYDASYELVRAHLSLLEWYNSNGGDDIRKALKEKQHAFKDKGANKKDPTQVPTGTQTPPP